MTNSWILYSLVAITLIVAVSIVFVIVKRNADGKFDHSAGQTAMNRPYLAIMLYPLFIILGICIIALVSIFF